VLTVAAQNNNTIVVVHSVRPLILEPWIEYLNVTAVRRTIYSPLLEFISNFGDPQVLWAGLPGQEAGNSLVDVLYCGRNPPGRLPYTIAK
jgi:beta-glucosidase